MNKGVCSPRKREVCSPRSFIYIHSNYKSNSKLFINVLGMCCLFLGKTQEEGLRRVEDLKTELNLLNDTKREEKKRQIQLQQEHATLTEELTTEKVLKLPGLHYFYV